MPFATTTTNTILFLAIFILAFFPGAFYHLIRLPLVPLGYLTYSTQSSTALSPTPTCCCCTTSTPHTSTPIPTSATSEQTSTMSWFQKTFTLPSKSRGSYLVTDAVVKELPELKNYKVGLLN
ncbi:hypothetical protein LTR28_001899, partial [Elasticomyces elasticus]